MKIRIAAVVAVLACGIIIGAEQGALKVKQYQIDVTVVDESTQPEIKQRHVALISEGKFHLQDGGDFHTDQDGTKLEFGTKIDGSIKDNEKEDGGKRIELNVEFSHRVAGDDSSTQVVVGDVLKMRTCMVVGECKRIHCGGKRYCVLLFK